MCPTWMLLEPPQRMSQMLLVELSVLIINKNKNILDKVSIPVENSINFIYLQKRIILFSLLFIIIN
jgi:hypothetical protein